MREYELVLVLRPSLSEAQRTKVLDTVKSWLKNVKVAKNNEWGQKPLAYPIKKEVSGYYVDYVLEADVPTVGAAGASGLPADLEKRILGNNDVIRHLLVRKK